MEAEVLRIRLEHEREMQRMQLGGGMKLRLTDVSHFSTSCSKGQSIAPTEIADILK